MPKKLGQPFHFLEYIAGGLDGKLIATEFDFRKFEYSFFDLILFLIKIFLASSYLIKSIFFLFFKMPNKSGQLFHPLSLYHIP